MFRSRAPWLPVLLLLGCQSAEHHDRPQPLPDVFAWYGKTVEAATAIAERDGIPHRIVREDDQRFPLTRDLIEGRVNWEIEKGIVIHSRTEGRNSQAEGSQDLELRPYVGLTEAAGRQRASTAKVPFRVLGRDGESFPVTADYVSERVNVELRAGIIVHVTGG